jgi:hypothetical protein
LILSHDLEDDSDGEVGHDGETVVYDGHSGVRRREEVVT